jgi:hypothetical protein
MKLIKLKGQYGEGKFTKVSDEDFDFVSKLNLYVNDGYVKTYYKGRHWKLHQLLVGGDFDHINRDKLDNRRENLRPATRSQNNSNRAYQNETGYRGVYKDKTCKNSWIAAISVQGRMQGLGSFPNPRWAAMARDLQAQEAFGEFAELNFIASADSPLSVRA